MKSIDSLKGWKDLYCILQLLESTWGVCEVLIGRL